MTTSGLGCRIMHVALITFPARHRVDAPGTGSYCNNEGHLGPPLTMSCWGQPSQVPQNRGHTFQVLSSLQ